jgi:excinuclease ABC subunit A
MHIRVLLSKYRAYTECLACLGTRPQARRGAVEDRRQVDPRPGAAADFLGQGFLRRAERTTTRPPTSSSPRSARGFATLRGRVGYLTLDRQSRTLSGGEVQRINLTTALGTSLVNTLFVLDEPSIGLHPRDMGRVIDVMKRLRDAGNSLVVVEHDPQIMFAADRILDMGPGPGERGGEIVFFGSPGQAAKVRHADGGVPVWPQGGRSARKPAQPHSFIEVLGAAEHNLKNIDVRFPLDRLVCITGVSGSGKSTLVEDVLYAALRKAKGKPTETPGAHRALKGGAKVSDVVLVDQSADRQDHALQSRELRRRLRRDSDPVCQGKDRQGARLHAGHLQLQLRQRPLPDLLGCGFEHVEMQFLSDVYLRCPDCDGKRYRNEILEVTIEGSRSPTCWS